MSHTTEVFCCFRQVGFHSWPSAPNVYAYLRASHRHEFHVEVRVKVHHSDRYVEFIELKNLAHEVFRGLSEFHPLIAEMPNFGSASCEMLAERLRDAIQALTDPKDARIFLYRVTEVTVSEDGENGATLRWE